MRDISDEKKVKLIALKLRKYASTWWANVLSKRAKKGKGKIKPWRKIKGETQRKVPPLSLLTRELSRLHHFKRGSLSIEEYTKEFEQLLIKSDLKEDEEQTW